MQKSGLLIGAFLGLNGVVLSSAAFGACPGKTQTEMNICATAEYKRVDAQLLAVYRKFRPISPALRASERTWISYRDAECKFENEGFIGGTIYGLEQAACLESLTKERIAVLKGDLQNQEQ